jgi:hypothetical protein
MRRSIAFVGRLLLAAALAYLILGVVWETAFDLALTRSPTSDNCCSPWNGPISFLAWFVLPSAFWPSSMSAFIPGGWLIAAALFIGMTALMFGALMRLAPGVAVPIGPRRPPRPRSAPRARAGRPRTS